MFFSVKISRQGTSSSFSEQKQQQKWCQGSVSVRWWLWCDPFQPIWDKKKKHLGKKKQITALHRAWRKTSSDVQTFLFSSTFQSAINDLRSGLHFTGGRIALNSLMAGLSRLLKVNHRTNGNGASYFTVLFQSDGPKNVQLPWCYHRPPLPQPLLISTVPFRNPSFSTVKH